MSVEELNTLRDEAAAQVAAQVTEEARAEAPPADLLPPVDEGLSQALAAASMGVGGIICRRLRVTGLAKEEADALGASLAQLATVYDVGPKDPKGAAWMGFAMVMLGVVGNREKLPEEPKGEGAVPVPEVAPPPPVFGATGETSLSLSNP